MDTFAGYGGSVLGALTVAAVGGVAWCVKNKFSKCDLDSGCLKISSQEDEDERRSTIRREVLDQLRREGVLPPISAEDGATLV